MILYLVIGYIILSYLISIPVHISMMLYVCHHINSMTEKEYTWCKIGKCYEKLHMIPVCTNTFEYDRPPGDRERARQRILNSTIIRIIFAPVTLIQCILYLANGLLTDLLKKV